MKKVFVRCWAVYNYRDGVKEPDRLFITYPDSDCGHKLIVCKNCGELYAITIAKEIYIGPPLQAKLENTNCVACGINLQNNFAPYPETYVVDGSLFNFQRDLELPSDSDSFVREFYGVYE